MSNVDTADDVATQVGADAVEQSKIRILHTLSIFPKLSHSMLQIGIGTGFPASLWHPALDMLVQEGKVQRKQITMTHPLTKREQTYQYVMLTDSDDDRDTTADS